MDALKIIATGSTGNCYELTHDGQSIVLDCGIPWRRIVKGTNALENVTACLITHEHGDHAASAYKMAEATRMIMSMGTARACMIQRYGRAVDKQPMSDGAFRIMPFAVEHDAAEPLGYMIRTPDGTQLVYMTDTQSTRYRFPHTTDWLIECNYCTDLLEGTSPALRERIERSHMSLDRLKQLLAANDLSNTRRIILCHLSADRSNEARMVREIAELTGKTVLAADAGMEIELC